jgi:hypothetical protein
MTDEEFRDAVKREATRPVDERMLRCLYRALEEQVVAYGRFTDELERQARAIQLGYCGRWDRPALAARRSAAIQKLGIFSSELENVLLFVSEARAERSSDTVRTGETTADTAAWLAIRLHHIVQQLWTMAIGSRTDPPIHPERILAVLGSSRCPPARDVQTLLHQEHAVARLVLRARTGRASEPVATLSGPVTIQAAQCTVTGDSVALNGPPTTASKRPLSKPVPPLSVDRWSDLSLAVDAHHRVWAIARRIETGASFPKSEAVELSLGGRQWRVLLNLAAESRSGCTVPRSSFITEARLATKGGGQRAEPRARAGDVEMGRCADDRLSSRRDPTKHSLRTALATLRKRLREQVAGPKDRSCSLLSPDCREIRTGFIVRHLLEEDGHYRFGNQPTA